MLFVEGCSTVEKVKGVLVPFIEERYCLFSFLGDVKNNSNRKDCMLELMLFAFWRLRIHETSGQPELELKHVEKPADWNVRGLPLSPFMQQEYSCSAP